MKKLIINTLLFVLLPYSIVMVLVLFSNTVIKNKIKIEVPQTIDNIVIGSSDVGTSLNDSLISNFKNFAGGGYSYFYMYYKAKELIKQNKHIKTVFIGFHNGHVRPSMNVATWGDNYLPSRYKEVAPLMDFEGYRLLFTKNWKCFVLSQFVLLKNNYKIISTGNYDYSDRFGGYLSLNRRMNDSLIQYLYNRPQKVSCRNFEFSECSMLYLEKTILEFKKYNIRVILMRCPCLTISPNLDNEILFKHMVSKRFSNVLFIDFKNFPLTNFEYGDYVHVNNKGAVRFSLFFDELLKKGLLEKPDMQQFITTEIARIKMQDHLNSSSN